MAFDLNRYTIYPKTHYVTPREVLVRSISLIQEELNQRLAQLQESNRLVEAQRLEQRTNLDIEMIQQLRWIEYNEEKQ